MPYVLITQENKKKTTQTPAVIEHKRIHLFTNTITVNSQNNATTLTKQKRNHDLGNEQASVEAASIKNTTTKVS